MLPEEARGMQRGTRKRHRPRPAAGFSMIEIMLVLALIALITSSVVVNLRRRAREAQSQVARVRVQELSGAAFQYRLANRGDCPPREPTPDERSSRNDNRDPWGRPYLVVCPGEHDQDGLDVVSLGPDGRPGQDDIESWKL
jgi:general secretion pathway protein G